MNGICNDQRILYAIIAGIATVVEGFVLIPLGPYILHRATNSPFEGERPKWYWWVILMISTALMVSFGGIAAAAPSKPCDDIIITKIICDPGKTNPLAEVVVLQNVDQHAINLKGWTLCDNQDLHCFKFEHFKLEPQASVELWTGVGMNTDWQLYWNSQKPIWNNADDTARLLDKNGNIVAQKACPPAPTRTPTSTFTLTYTPTLTATNTNTPTPSRTPTFTETQTPIFTLTITKVQVVSQSTTIPGGVNGNPWGYNFDCCKTIYNPPSTFCSYFNCVSTFWSGSGYVVQCKDGTYSKSGGKAGCCAGHNGVLRALLEP